jgi:hypothetical protein
MKQLDQEKVEIIVNAMDAILKAIDCPITMESMLEQQNALLAMLPKEQQAPALEAIRNQTAAAIASSFGMAAETFKQQLEAAVKEKADKPAD